MDKTKFRKVVYDVIDELSRLGYELPDSLKRRDDREPGRDLKESIEDRLQLVFRRNFKKQLEAILARLRKTQEESGDDLIIMPVQTDDLINSSGDDLFMASLIKTIGIAALGGIDLFKESMMTGIDYTLVNQNALDFAKNYSYELISKATGGIDITTRNAVSRAMQRFVSKPGYTIGDAARELEPIFGLDRARTIAVTETTRIFSEGDQIAGNELKQQFPDLLITKTWFTNNDDRVCEICAPLNGETVEISENFSNGEQGPPAHVNCRCFRESRTRINAR